MTKIIDNAVIPPTMERDYHIREQRRELARRQARSYAWRMYELAKEEYVFGKCKTRRPDKRRAKNTASKEAAGTKGEIVMGVRTGRYSVCVCKTKDSRF